MHHDKFSQIFLGCLYIFFIFFNYYYYFFFFGGGGGGLGGQITASVSVDRAVDLSVIFR